MQSALRHFRLVAFAPAIACLALAPPASAATVDPGQTGFPIVTLVPSQDTVNVGDSFNVDLVVSGFEGTGVQGVSGYDIAIGWVNPILSLNSFAVGTALGDPALGESIDTSAGQTSPNVVEVGQTSLLPASYLTMELPDAIVLATFEFTAVAAAPGCFCVLVSAFPFTPMMYDGNGDPFDFDVIVEGALVSVVPLPASVWLLIAGLACLPRRRM